MFEVLFWPSFLLMTFYVHPSVSCIWFQSPAMQHNMTEPWPLPLPCLSLAVINKATFMPGLAISLSPVRQLPMLFLIVQLTSSLQSRAGFFTTVSSPRHLTKGIWISIVPPACPPCPPPVQESHHLRLKKHWPLLTSRLLILPALTHLEPVTVTQPIFHHPRFSSLSCPLISLQSSCPSESMFWAQCSFFPSPVTCLQRFPNPCASHVILVKITVLSLWLNKTCESDHCLYVVSAFGTISHASLVTGSSHTQTSTSVTPTTTQTWSNQDPTTLGRKRSL